MALAAAAAGSDGIMVEVHNNPSCALCDGSQSLTPAQFAKLNERIERVREAIL
jgi:3-deoxy-7-phosphoheptulonate synthase